MDRTYVRLPGHAWHGFSTWTRVSGRLITLCGRTLVSFEFEDADRVPSSGHLCGNCSRIIAAKTDVEQ